MVLNTLYLKVSLLLLLLSQDKIGMDPEELLRATNQVDNGGKKLKILKKKNWG